MGLMEKATQFWSIHAQPYGDAGGGLSASPGFVGTQLLEGVGLAGGAPPTGNPQHLCLAESTCPLAVSACLWACSFKTLACSFITFMLFLIPFFILSILGVLSAGGAVASANLFLHITKNFVNTFSPGSGGVVEGLVGGASDILP
jgi:hypothetical protein